MALPSYADYMTREAPEIDAAWSTGQGHPATANDARLSMNRRYIERWIHPSICEELLGKPVADELKQWSDIGGVNLDQVFLGGPPVAGVTAFRLPQLLISGEDIRPHLQLFKAAGFNLLRVFGMKYNNTGWELDPHKHSDYFSSDLPRFFELLHELDLGCEWNCLVDTRQLMPNGAEQQDFFARTCDAFRSYAAANPSHRLMSLGNEVTNGSWQSLNLAAFAAPAGLHACHGSSQTDEHPVEPYWTYGTYGARRKAHENDARFISTYCPFAFEEELVRPCPIFAVEGLKPEGYGYDAKIAFCMGAAARAGVGGVFHSAEGINGQLLPREVERCARAFVAGVLG
jgi:hypothetical protein